MPVEVSGPFHKQSAVTCAQTEQWKKVDRQRRGCVYPQIPWQLAAMERRSRRTVWGQAAGRASPRSAALVLSCGVPAASDCCCSLYASVTNAEIFLSVVLSSCYLLLKTSWAASNPGTSPARERDSRAPGVVCRHLLSCHLKPGHVLWASYNPTCLPNSTDTIFKWEKGLLMVVIWVYTWY